MLAVSIKGPTYKEALEAIQEVLAYADAIELRLDCFISLENIEELFGFLPVIVTLRCKEEGGCYMKSSEERLKMLFSLGELLPDYIDIESSVPQDFVKEFQKRYSSIKIILSKHDFERMPEDLDAVFVTMCQTQADFYKIAVSCQNTLESLQFLEWVQKRNDPRLIPIAMGTYGEISRILGPIFRVPITYASFREDHATAPGQLTAKMLIERYHHNALTPTTRIYALLGDPVEGSISHQTHNRFFEETQKNAVYVKIQVQKEELQSALLLIKKLPFYGLSITMPLKEVIIPYLDELDEEASLIQAVNTVVIENGKTIGYNTDGVGAIQALEKHIEIAGKTIALIGFGGAAKAIAYEATKKKGQIIVFLRNPQKVTRYPTFAIQQFSVLSKECSIFINCTPSDFPIDPKDIPNNSYVMDIKTKPKETRFLTEAKKQQCTLIYGYEMFTEQAIGQFILWFGNEVSAQSALFRDIVELFV